MKKLIHQTGKFYTGIIMSNIGIFIFIGILSVIFHEDGWIPNEDIYAISQLVYKIFLPVLIAYEGGERIGGKPGGVAGVLGAAGIVASQVNVGILGAAVMGALGGALWRYGEKLLKQSAGSSLQMLTRNLYIGGVGTLLMLFGMYVAAPGLGMILNGVEFLFQAAIERRLLVFLHIMIEPMKVFFLNNSINHGVLVPIGMEQVQMTGKSILFLLETNPGPGIGLLLALYVSRKEKRPEYASALFAHGIGGIHEIYFPFVLSEIWLLVPLILGGMAGTLCFSLMDVGAAAAVSPGSVITLLLLCGKSSFFGAASGIVVSSLVSFGASCVVLNMKRSVNQEKDEEDADQISEEEKKVDTSKSGPIRRIGFVCDAGVGSSAMGASLFRRKLAGAGIQGVDVQAYAADSIPPDLDLIICQQMFVPLIPDGVKCPLQPVESLMGGGEFEELIERIKKVN